MRCQWNLALGRDILINLNLVKEYLSQVWKKMGFFATTKHDFVMIQTEVNIEY